MSGILLLDPGAPSFAGGVAEVTVEDVRRADAAATPLAALTLDGIAHRRGRSERIAFAFDCPEPPARGMWAVRAALDRPGHGQFTTDRVHVSADGDAIILRLCAVEASGP